LHVDKFPSASKIQQHLSMALRVFFFGFLTASFVGLNWYLYIGCALIAIPWFVGLYKNHFPNSPKLFQIMPAGLPGLLFVLVTCSFVHELVGSMAHEEEAVGKLMFITIPITTGIISLIGNFGREPVEGDVLWYLRSSNKYIYRFGGVIVLLGFLYIVHFIPRGII